MSERIAAGRPETDEIPSYLSGYIARCDGPDVVAVLEAQLSTLESAVDGVADRAGWRYADGKWSVHEVIGHVIDCERIFGYRLLAVARGERGSLPGFDENEYVAAADFDRRTTASLGEELRHLRRSGLALMSSFDDEAWRRSGVANGTPVSVRALAWAIAGHADHHLGVLRERYGIATSTSG